MRMVDNYVLQHLLDVHSYLMEHILIFKWKNSSKNDVELTNTQKRLFKIMVQWVSRAMFEEKPYPNLPPYL